MKKKAFMITLLLAFIGCVLIGLSIFFVYQGSFYANEKSAKAKNELEVANKEIECLNQELKEKTLAITESENKLKKFKSESFSQVAGQNLPVIEISSADLGEGASIEGKHKKVHRLMYSHQIKFSLLNVGKSSLKDVIFSIKDVYNGPKDKRKNKKPKGNYDYMGQSINDDEIGSYENIEVGTLNLKSKKMIYTSNLPSSFGVGDYSYHVIVEWNNGFYQMDANIEEIDGKLKFKYQFFDVNGKEIDFKSLEENINN